MQRALICTPDLCVRDSTELPMELKAREDLQTLTSYHSPQLDVEVRLNTNESPYPPPAKFLSEFSKKLKKLDLNRYPDRSALQLRSAIADFHKLALPGETDKSDTETDKSDTGIGKPDAETDKSDTETAKADLNSAAIGPNCIIAGNGSNEVLQALVLAYAGAGNKAAVFEPTYTLHSHICQIAGSEVLVGRRNSKWQVEISEIKEVLSRGAKIVFLCSPNNPTATVEDSQFLLDAADLCAKAGALLVIDRAYAEFEPLDSNNLDSNNLGSGGGGGDGGGSGYATFDLTDFSFIENDLPVVLVHTFSKSWALAGMRLGYGIASPAIIRELEKILLPYNLSAPAMLAGELIFGYADDMAKRNRDIAEGRGFIFKELMQINASISAKKGAPAFELWESVANFIFFRVAPEAVISARDIWKKLVEKSILIRHYPDAAGIQDCLRVTVGTPEENKRFLSALKGILNI